MQLISLAESYNKQLQRDAAKEILEEGYTKTCIYALFFYMKLFTVRHFAMGFKFKFNE